MKRGRRVNVEHVSGCPLLVAHDISTPLCVLHISLVRQFGRGSRAGQAQKLAPLVIECHSSIQNQNGDHNTSCHFYDLSIQLPIKLHRVSPDALTHILALLLLQLRASIAVATYHHDVQCRSRLQRRPFDVTFCVRRAGANKRSPSCTQFVGYCRLRRVGRRRKVAKDFENVILVTSAILAVVSCRIRRVLKANQVLRQVDILSPQGSQIDSLLLSSTSPETVCRDVLEDFSQAVLLSVLRACGRVCWYGSQCITSVVEDAVCRLRK